MVDSRRWYGLTPSPAPVPPMPPGDALESRVSCPGPAILALHTGIGAADVRRHGEQVADGVALILVGAHGNGSEEGIVAVLVLGGHPTVTAKDFLDHGVEPVHGVQVDQGRLIPGDRIIAEGLIGFRAIAEGRCKSACHGGARS